MLDFVRYQALFADFIQKNPFDKKPKNLYAPVDYIISLGGKRLRPIFALLGYDLYTDNPEEALKIAMAVEIFHNFTLVHDDIMDESDLRRGKPTVHKKFSINHAILSGDVMLIKAYDYLTEGVDASLLKPVLIEFSKMAQEVCEGQQYDVDFENRDDVTISEYIHMVTLKTAVLLACAIKIGAMAGGAPELDAYHLYEFAKNYGIAFQLQDDYLDTFGSEAEVGKKIGSDILKNKKTYLYLKALELSGSEDKSMLEILYRENQNNISNNDKVATVTRIFRDAHVDVYSKQLIEVYRDLAWSHLNACNINESSKNQIFEFMNTLLFRSH